jgi:energy-coupling factor transport system permease protein
MIRSPLAWGAWAVAALAAAFIDRSPFLQVMLVLMLINVWLVYRGPRGSTYWKVGLVLAVVPILFSAALSRFGRHQWFSLPPNIPVIGGAWTWEAVVYGASTGVALLLTVAVFGVLRSTVRSADLLSLLPQSLYRAGTAVALALAFAPKTAASFVAIREARRLRGYRAGWRSAPGMLVPLLLTTLEQALQYGESLDARGYGSGHRSRYRPLPWSGLDGASVAASIAALMLTLGFSPPPYNPYLDLAPIAPTALSLIAIVLLAMPAVTAALPRGDHADRHA